jgi:hypothetical protein
MEPVGQYSGSRLSVRQFFCSVVSVYRGPDYEITVLECVQNLQTFR